MLPMKKVSLQFRTLSELWTFKAKARLSSLVILSNAILVCDLLGSDIQLAISDYGAKLLDGFTA